jgi:5-methylcytosine-specific restriction protein A
VAFIREVSEADLRREKAKARTLRATQWWKRKVGSGRCGYCERSTPPRQLTMDHRVPLVRGGRSTRSNVVAACKACNDAKKYLLPVEWDAYLARLAVEGEKHWTTEEGRS